MVKSKVCAQCGQLKEIEHYRGYYGNRKGTYKICKTCEKINARAKYLTRKTRDEKEEDELQKIYTLWDAQRSVGLQAPSKSNGNKKPIAESLDEMIDQYAMRAQQLQERITFDISGVPAELSRWLTEALVEEPEHYQDTVYEDLRVKFMPEVSVNMVTMLPVYDETYKHVLEAIAERFDEYEDSYYGQ